MTNLTDVLPPHSVAAEIQVIGSLLTAGDKLLIADIIAGLPADAFFQADHQEMYRAVVDIFTAGEIPDSVLLRDELDRKGILAECGGADYIHTVAERAMLPTNGPAHAKRVLATWKLREAIRICSDVARRCYGPQKLDANAVLTEAGNALLLAASSGRADSIISVGDAIAKLVATLESKESLYLPTGLTEFDDTFYGLPVGGYTLIGADSRTGKSLVARDILIRMAKRQVPGGVIAMEETPGKISANVLAGESQVESRRIMSGRMHSEEWTNLRRSVAGASRLPIYIETVASTIEQIESAIAVLAIKHKCQAIVLDHFHLIDFGSVGDGETAAQSHVSGRLKRAFQRHNVAGVVLDQVNKGGNLKDRPTERDLRGTNRKFNDADLVVLLYRQDFYLEQQHKATKAFGDFVPTNTLDVIVVKNKTGLAGTLSLKIDTAHQRLIQPAGGEVPDFGGNDQ